MDSTHPELDDVCNAIKEACAEFGINVVRADDVQHDERITDVVLKRIETAQLLFADLTGERPNVYYEVGYAHSIGKRTILFRRSGGHVHFDLSVHNVPEYASITSLKNLLRRRLENLTGRQSKHLQTGP